MASVDINHHEWKRRHAHAKMEQGANINNLNFSFSKKSFSNCFYVMQQNICKLRGKQSKSATLPLLQGIIMKNVSQSQHLWQKTPVSTVNSNFMPSELPAILEKSLVAINTDYSWQQNPHQRVLTQCWWLTGRCPSAHCWWWRWWNDPTLCLIRCQTLPVRPNIKTCCWRPTAYAYIIYHCLRICQLLSMSSQSLLSQPFVYNCSFERQSFPPGYFSVYKIVIIIVGS